MVPELPTLSSTSTMTAPRRYASKPLTSGGTSYGGMNANDAKRLKELENVNRRLDQVMLGE